MSCIEWTGATNGHGYGQRSVGNKLQQVHRLEWAAHHGPIPDGMVVMHTCDNKRCYNIEHLQLGTQFDNLRDAAAKGLLGGGHRSKTHCRNGHEFTPENTYVRPNGHRACRTCRKTHH